MNSDLKNKIRKDLFRVRLSLKDIFNIKFPNALLALCGRILLDKLKLQGWGIKELVLFFKPSFSFIMNHRKGN